MKFKYIFLSNFIMRCRFHDKVKIYFTIYTETHLIDCNSNECPFDRIDVSNIILL